MLNKQAKVDRERAKKSSDTGTRTRVSCVKGKYANHLHHIGCWSSSEYFTFYIIFISCIVIIAFVKTYHDNSSFFNCMVILFHIFSKIDTTVFNIFLILLLNGFLRAPNGLFAVAEPYAWIPVKEYWVLVRIFKVNDIRQQYSKYHNISLKIFHFSVAFIWYISSVKAFLFKIGSSFTISWAVNQPIW